ncbi:hypothetical protein DL766_000002 [Monosporascus sp. MC13-8B]|uniref:Carboxylic ester hydrolase n=1 Tax=Monosporascus cannonballus TaxID=155416 RepID=A0ABY0HKN3_9PEZI|nr:hypothetical protein DL762_000371 [Monosporascus cannonballus]RYP01225.1 hypothetical protein DL763_000350 [Monosporascus cannonballus]RYP40201.1 hypothetical protein DL766_000002 [Monosporascus sp. MC13-8B]
MLQHIEVLDKCIETDAKAHHVSHVRNLLHWFGFDVIGDFVLGKPFGMSGSMPYPDQFEAGTYGLYDQGLARDCRAAKEHTARQNTPRYLTELGRAPEYVERINEELKSSNKGVDGRLVPTVPITSVCHSGAPEAYGADACATLQAVWNYPHTHCVTSSYPMTPFFANASCDHFTAPSSQTVIGAYLQYPANARGIEDYQTTTGFGADK